MAEKIPADEKSVFEMLSTLEKQAIVRPNNPPPGIAGFLFDVVTEDAIEVTAHITDHYVEDNTVIHDHIALPPEQITVRGIVAELTTARATPEQRATVPEALPLNDAYAPALAPQAEEQENDVTAADDATTNAATAQQSLYGYFNAQSAQQPSQTRQTKAFRYFYALYRARMVFSVETPWGTMTNCAIERLRQEQGEESAHVSELTIVFKKVRTAAQLTIADGQLAGRAVQQAAEVQQNGNAGQTKQTQKQLESWLYKAGKIFGLRE
jgi:hypothetical protein